MSYKKIICLFFVLLFTVGFHVRMKAFQRGVEIDRPAIDEALYFTLAVNLTDSWEDYNTIRIARQIREKGRRTPSEFDRPLFPHPPLFAGSMALMLKVFGKTLFSVKGASAATVPIICGLLLCWAGYLLAHELYGRTVAWMTALWIWIDPVNASATQKLLPDSMMALWMTVSCYFLVKFLRTGFSRHILWGGVFSGLGALTKYPGALPVLVFAVYTIFASRSVWRRKSFWLALAMPFVMLIPWGIWNLKVYGMEYFEIYNQYFFRIFTNRNLLIFFILAVVVMVFRKFKGWELLELIKSPWLVKKAVLVIGSAVFFCFFHQPIFNSLDLTFIPAVSKYNGQLPAGRLFYFERMIEYSFLYVLSFSALAAVSRYKVKAPAYAQVLAVVIIGFYTMWGSYQSRYILPAIPILAACGCHLGLCLHRKIRSINSKYLKFGFMGIEILVLWIVLFRIAIFQSVIVSTNNYVYF